MTGQLAAAARSARCLMADVAILLRLISLVESTRPIAPLALSS